MKVKEKLADDYESEHPSGFSYTGAAYLAGFEKARGMAAAIANRESKVEREIFEASLPLWASRPSVVRSEAIAMQIDYLGEEEVPGEVSGGVKE